MDKWFFQRYEPEFENGAISLVASNDEKCPKLANLRRSPHIKKTANSSVSTAIITLFMLATS